MMNQGAHRLAVLVVAFLCSVTLAADPIKPQRWAVVATPALRSLPAWDLLAVEFSKLDGVQMVERERLDAVAGELSVTGLVGPADSAKRINAGRIAGADVLVLMSEDRDAGRNRFRLVVTDCVQGARLSSEYLPWPAMAAKQEQFARDVAGIAGRVRERFPAGVKWVVGVTPLASKDLSHEHDALQANSAVLIANALSAVPGVAVIETEEAHAIRNEQDLAGARVNRVMPVIIRGEYAYNGDAVSFDVTLDTGGTARPIKEANLKPDAAAAFLSDRLPKAVLAAASAGGQPPSIDQQFALLVERGDRLAAVGAWELAVRLRNAALMLKPDAVDQRAASVRETARWLDSLPRARALRATSRPAKTSPLRAAWDRAAADLEYLVRNRKVTPDQALDLSSTLMRSSVTLDEFGNVHNQPFLRDVFPAVLAMVPKDDPRRLEHLARWQDVLISGHGLYEQTFSWPTLRLVRYKSLAAALEQQAPADPVPSDVLARAIKVVADRFYVVEPGWPEFLQTLSKSKKPSLNWAGRYGMLWQRWYHDKVQAKEILPDAEALQREIAAATNGRPSELGRFVDAMVEYFRSSANVVGKPDGTLILEPPAPRQISTEPPLPREPIVGQVRYKQIKFAENATDTTTQQARLVRGGPKLDIFVSEWILILYPLGGKPKTIQPNIDGFSDAAWDGERVWVGDRKRGILLYSPEGEQLGLITATDGLPGVEHAIKLFAIGEGRVIAAGCFGPENRAWCAEVQWDGKQAKVNVFHQARNATTITDAGPEVLTDPELAFMPLWIKESARSDDGARRTLLVGRLASPDASARYPLRIEMPAKRVDVVDLGLQGVDLAAIRSGEAKGLGPSQNFLFLPDGTVLLPDEEGVRQFPSPGDRFARDEAVRRVCTLDTWMSGGWRYDNGRPVKSMRDSSFGVSMNSLFMYKGQVYYPGPTWVRFDPVTRQTVRLKDGKRETAVNYYADFSEARGPIMWDDYGRLWQVGFDEPPSTTRPTSQP